MRRLAHADQFVKLHQTASHAGKPLVDEGPRVRSADTLLPPSDALAPVALAVPPEASVGDDFVQIPLPRLVDGSGRQIGVAAEQYRREAAIVDARLSRKITLGVKATALADLCDQIRAESGIHLVAGRSIADEKVTLFCEKMPLRDVMRQLSRPFGYAWLRSTLNAQRSTLNGSGSSVERRASSVEYRYELVQDLRSQLLEEELRNRDRNAALLALDAEMQRYRPYLDLSPDEALAQARAASPEEKKLLERYGGAGWGPTQLYFRLSPNDLSQMRAGKPVTFSAERSRAWQPDHQPLPAELARGTLQTQRKQRIIERDGRLVLGESNGAEGLPPAQVPAARAIVRLQIEQSELGQFTFSGASGCFISESVQPSGSFYMFVQNETLAVGMSPAVLNPRNAEANARLARDPTLQRPVTVRPTASCHLLPEPPRGQASETNSEPEPRVTSADLLEALHRATGRPIVADYYTRLYPPAELSARNAPLFDALNNLADRMGLRWNREGEWLQFRSASYFHDRLKEVPNRLLTRWAASRQRNGVLALDDLIEIAQLTDAQLDASSMAEGARAIFGLAEWVLARNRNLRPHLRYLAQFSPAQRQEARSPAGLAFKRMTLQQQQGYLERVPGRKVELAEVAGYILRVDYTLPGEFQWLLPGWRRYLPSRVRERTQIAALQAAHRIDPNVPDEQIVPTRLDLIFLYAPAGENPPRAGVARSDSSGSAP
jgi:hypothetical protein